MSSVFSEAVSRRILILDGAMGTEIQGFGLQEEDFRAGVLSSAADLKGDNECLNLTRPDVIRKIHDNYIAAGADIISTNSFGANRLSQSAYGLSDEAARMAEASARIARAAADAAGRKVFVAGSVGPGGRSLSLSSDPSDPAVREYDFDDLKAVYGEQIGALIKGGVDLILLETWFDALNAKAAILAFEELGADVPLIISATVSDRSGRTLTGQTLEAFFHSVRHAPNLAAFGLNCALGAAQMTSLVNEISDFSDLPLLFYPNAGIPDELGRYNDTPAYMASVLCRLAANEKINIAGGCCGSTPEHIRAIASAMASCTPRIISDKFNGLTVSGLEAVTVDPSRNFTNIGERTNVAGSRKFARLIAGGQYDEALQVAAAQIEGGADIIDINMDDAMLDSAKEMRTFLRHISSDPSVARAAIMIDSSNWATIEEGLKNAQGKCIVNSISLKDGQEEFLRRARFIRSMGAAMVVMAFDEEGQATTYDRKVEICERSFRLLTQEAGVNPRDIIFDVNVLSIGTGIAEHSKFGVDFIEAVRYIRSQHPQVHCSGGISNLSFSFRGNNAVREAMHSAFLYHAIKAGLDMAIVNPQMLQVYDSIEPELLRCVEDVIFDSDAEATTRLVQEASEVVNAAQETDAEQVADEPTSASERLVKALVKGGSTTLSEDLMECLAQLGEAVKVIEGPLMQGMETVGTLFAEGKMFLPQVVKSAKVMRTAVDILQPYLLSASSSGDKPKVVMATVKGDVHDIGKNITGIVLQCSGFEVIDLGVMVPADDILAKAEEVGAVIIGVSGLITPSLHRMEELCTMMAAKGMTTPLFVGGAAASAVHTAVKLSPLYKYVVYGSDASASAVKAKKYMASPAEFIESENAEHLKFRTLHSSRSNSEVALTDSYPTDSFISADTFKDINLQAIPNSEIIQYFDWRLFYAVCGIKTGKSPIVSASPTVIEVRKQAEKYLESGRFRACCEVVFKACHREGDNIVSEDGTVNLPMLRQRNGEGRSLADFFPEAGLAKASPLGFFAGWTEDSENEDTSGNLVLHAVKVTLAEAASAWMQDRFENMASKVIMPGIGYNCCPDHSLKRDVLARLHTPIVLSDSCAMIPEASVCGFVIAHPQAHFPEITEVASDALEKYAQARGFSPEERELFLGHIAQF